MSTGTPLMALLLAVTMPAQEPLPSPAPAPTTVKVYYPVPVPVPTPVPAPVVVAPGCGPGVNCANTCAALGGPCGAEPAGSPLCEKFRKLCGWLCYKSQYRTPCCARSCPSYRPPLYEWFRTCADGAPTPAPCTGGCGQCPTCLKPGHALFGQPTGQGCPGGGCGPLR